MDKMADAYIALAAAPAPDKGSDMPFPSSLRRSTKLFDKVLRQANPPHCHEGFALQTAREQKYSLHYSSTEITHLSARTPCGP